MARVPRSRTATALAGSVFVGTLLAQVVLLYGSWSGDSALIPLAVAVVLSASVALASGAIASALLVRPLRAITRASRALAEGDFSERLELRARGEVGELGRALDQLADALQTKMVSLAAQRDRLDAVLGSMTEGVAVTDADRRIRMVNPAFLRIAARSEDVIGRTLLEATRLEPLDVAIRRATAGDAAFYQELELTHPQRSLVVTATPLSSPKKPIGAVLVVRDVTDSRRLQTIRRDFVANVSHELKTPLTAVRGYSETLLDGAIEDREVAEPFVRTILDHALRMSALINDLLSLTALESGAHALSKESLDVTEALRSAIRHVQAAADARGARVEVTATDAPPRVAADSGALGQVLVNLLENAVKYGPEGGRVRVGVASGDGQVAIAVEDEGPGIPAEARERIFERFYRVDPGRSREMGGTGLGLAIVRHLVQAMDGTISVDCPEGGGSVFTVRLPAGEGGEAPAKVRRPRDSAA